MKRVFFVLFVFTWAVLFVFISPLLLAASTLSFSSDEVLNAAGTVLAEWHVPIWKTVNSELMTRKIEIDIDLLDSYIAESQQDENPGWTRARVSFLIKAHESARGDTEIMIEAFFERYGTRSALMLIPPSWVPVPSNGLLEKELRLDIEEKLTNVPGGIQ